MTKILKFFRLKKWIVIGVPLLVTLAMVLGPIASTSAAVKLGADFYGWKLSSRLPAFPA